VSELPVSRPAYASQGLTTNFVSGLLVVCRTMNPFADMGQGNLTDPNAMMNMMNS
jgi:hypothetical protein